MVSILSFSSNNTLYSHCKQIDNISEKTKLYGNIRKKNYQYITDLFSLSLNNLDFKKCFVYNTSPKNLILSLVFKIKKANVFFHLHDPIPHSGFLNPFLYLLNGIQSLISDVIIVFDNQLIDDSIKMYPFLRNKTFKVFKHGLPTFEYNKSIFSSNLKIGFFGRNMPYKNFNSFLKYVKLNPQYNYYVVGRGYADILKKNKLENIKLYDGYINDSKYYSIMLDVDYVYIPYKDISFSGVISDCIALDKKMLVSRLVYEKYKTNNMYIISNSANNLSKKNKLKILDKNLGWCSYHDSLINIK